MSDGPRLIIADNNIRNTGGYYFELANLLLSGAQQLGYRGILAAGDSFREHVQPCPPYELLPTFRSRSMIHWSLGVDGRSRFQRDINGKSIGGNWLWNSWINLRDLLRPRRSPPRMLSQCAEDFARLLIRLKLTKADSLLINSGHDFNLLAMAAAMKQCPIPPIRVDVLFHFALYDRARPDGLTRLEQLGRQIDSTVAMLAPHQIHLHATTATLAQQFEQTKCQTPVDAIPYPTRPSEPKKSAVKTDDEPLKAVLAGLPRKEKGKAAIIELLSEIEQPLLRTRAFRLSMQMPSQRWQAMIPPTLHRDYRRAVAGIFSEPLEIMTNNLTTEHYHQWLDTADLGLFLYNPDRYVARCSGVLLEMMVRGIPVIVPDGCWLADQVRLAGGHGSIGFIYNHRKQIPGLMARFAKDRAEMTSRAIEYAGTIAQRHSSKNALLQMGLPIVEHDGRKVA